MYAIRSYYEVDPLVCGACGSRMRVIGMVGPEQTEVIARIRCHLSRRNRGERPESRAPPGLPAVGTFDPDEEGESA